MESTPRRGVALQQGLRVGAVLGIVSLAVTTLVDTGIIPSLSQCAEFLVALAGFFIAGRLAASQTARIRSGVAAGAIASILPSIVVLGANVVMALVSKQQFATAFGWHDVSASGLVAIAVGQSLVGLVLWLAFGCGMGALGGMAGKRRSVASPTTVTPVAPVREG